ncbi:hypothetical protein H4R34_002227 [Dimargaris verticillata]|uniref:LAA1-like C-terminal TPR repeats domain-containing protein n=1 Tax=Dimargaris verticillata TaxID=2761393 RepID=A0A9W8B8D6_9FUNG|nr:hypothetical protein H4R34_002227 [Dimargaris verticillata]
MAAHHTSLAATEAAFAFDDTHFMAIKSPAEQELYLLQWLSRVEAQLTSTTQETLKAVQPRLEIDIIRLLSYPTLKPSKPLREIAGRCFVHLYLHGDTRTLLDTLQRLRSLILAKRGSGEQRETKMAAFYVVGQLFAVLGDRILSQLTEFLMLGLKFAKSTNEPLSLRLLAIDAIGHMLHGAGRIASDQTTKELVKQLKANVAEKPTSLGLAAIRALGALVQHTMYIANLSAHDFDQFLALCFRWLDTSVLVVRSAVAYLVAYTLMAFHKAKVLEAPAATMATFSSGRVLSSPGTAMSGPKSVEPLENATPGAPSVPMSPTNSATKTRHRMSRSHPPAPLTVGDVLQQLSAMFSKPQATRDLRAGLLDAYKCLFKAWGPAFVASHYPFILRHILAELAAMSITANTSRVERLSVRIMVAELLRDGLDGPCLIGGARVHAVQELLNHWIKLPSQLVLHSSPTTASARRQSSAEGTKVGREVALLCALHELAALIGDLADDTVQVQDGMLGPLLTLLSYPKHAVQMATAECLKQFAHAVPARLSKLLSRLLSLFQKDVANISNTGISAGVLKRCQGYCIGLTGLLALVPHRPLFVSYEIPAWVNSVALQLLKSALTPLHLPKVTQGPTPPGGTRNSDLRVVNAQLRMGWTLLAALVTLGPEFVRLHLTTWLLYWKLALAPSTPHASARALSSGPPGKPSPEQPDLDILHQFQVCEAALTALYNLVVYNHSHLLLGDTAKQIIGLLQSSVQFIQAYPPTRIQTLAVLMSSIAYNPSTQSSFSSQGSGAATALPCTLGLLECHYLYRRRLMDCFAVLLPVSSCEGLFPPLFQCVQEFITQPEPSFSGLGDFVYAKQGGQGAITGTHSGRPSGDGARGAAAFTGSYVAANQSTAFGNSALRWGHEALMGVSSLLPSLLREPDHRKLGFAITENLFDTASFYDFGRCAFGAFEHDLNNLFRTAVRSAPLDRPGFSTISDTQASLPPLLTREPSLAVANSSSSASEPLVRITTAPAYTAAIDAAIELFGKLFTHTNEAAQMAILQEFLAVQSLSALERHPDRKYALQVNMVLALFYALKELAMRGSASDLPDHQSIDPDTRSHSRALGTISTRVVQLMFDLLRRPIMHQDVHLRIAACETLGLLANQAGAKFISHTVNQLTMHAIHNRDPYARAGVALALGSIYSHAGSMTASVHLKSVVVLLHSLGRDLNPVVHNWGLHALAITIDAAGMMFVPYVGITLVMLSKLFMSETHEYVLEAPQDQLAYDLPVENARRGLGQVLCALLGAYGPELTLDTETKNLCLVLMRELQFDTHDLTITEYIRCCQQILMFAPQEISVRALVPVLVDTMRSQYPQVRLIGLTCLLQLVKRNAPEVLYLVGRDHILIQLFILADLHPGLADVQRVLNSVLEQAAGDQLIPFVDRLRAVFTRQPGQSGEDGSAIGAHRSAAAPDVTESQGGGLDEEGASFVAESVTLRPSQASNGATTRQATTRTRYSSQATEPPVSSASMTPQAFGTQTRALALRALQFLLRKHWDEEQAYRRQLALMLLPGSDTHTTADSNKPVYPLTTPLKELANKVADLIRIAFIAATCSNETLQAEGLGLLQVIIAQFAMYDDPDFPGVSMLEQYQAQITAAFAPAIAASVGMARTNGDSGAINSQRNGLGSMTAGGDSNGSLGADYSPPIQVLAIRLAAEFASSGISRDPTVLRRILKPLTSPLPVDHAVVTSMGSFPGPTMALPTLADVVAMPSSCESQGPQGLSPAESSDAIPNTPLSRERTISVRAAGLDLGAVTDLLNPHAMVIVRVGLLRAWATIFIASQTKAHLTAVLAPHLPVLCHLWLDALKDTVLVQLDPDLFTMTVLGESGAALSSNPSSAHPSFLETTEPWLSEPPSPADTTGFPINAALTNVLGTTGSTMVRSQSASAVQYSTSHADLMAEGGDDPAANPPYRAIGLSLGLDPTYAAATRNILAASFGQDWVVIIDAVGHMLAQGDATLEQCLNAFDAFYSGGAGPSFPRIEYILYGLCVQYLYVTPKTLKHRDSLQCCLRTLAALLRTPCVQHRSDVGFLVATPPAENGMADTSTIPFGAVVLEDTKIFTELWSVLDRIVQLESTPLRHAIVRLVQAVIDTCQNTLVVDELVALPQGWAANLAPTEQLSAPQAWQIGTVKVLHAQDLSPTSKLWQILALLLNVHKHSRTQLASIPLTMESTESPELHLVCGTLECFSLLTQQCTLLPAPLRSEVAILELHLLVTLASQTPLLGRNSGLVLRTLGAWLAVDYGTWPGIVDRPPHSQDRQTKPLTDAVVEALDEVMARCQAAQSDPASYRYVLTCVQGLSFAALLCSSVKGIVLPDEPLMGYFQDVAQALQHAHFKIVLGALQSVRLLFLQLVPNSDPGEPAARSPGALRLIAGAAYTLVPELVNLVCDVKEDPAKYQTSVDEFAQLQGQLYSVALSGSTLPSESKTHWNPQEVQPRIQSQYRRETPLTIVRVASWCLVQLVDVVAADQVAALLSIVIPTLVYVLADDASVGMLSTKDETTRSLLDGFHTLGLQHLVNLAKVHPDAFKAVVLGMDSASQAKLQRALRQDALNHSKQQRPPGSVGSALGKQFNGLSLHGAANYPLAGGSASVDESAPAPPPKIALKSSFGNFAAKS